MIVRNEGKRYFVLQFAWMQETKSNMEKKVKHVYGRINRCNTDGIGAVTDEKLNMPIVDPPW